jgi:hypothetical protein
MSGGVSDRKRLISITGRNLRNNHLYLGGHHDFFPDECHGESPAMIGAERKLKLVIEGLTKPVETDIAKNGSNGWPRNFFRKRACVGSFSKRHDIREGDVIALEKLNDFTYPIYPFESKNVREAAAIPNHRTTDVSEKTTIDLFINSGAMYAGKLGRWSIYT